MENSMEGPQNKIVIIIVVELSYDPAVLLLGICPKVN